MAQPRTPAQKLAAANRLVTTAEADLRRLAWQAAGMDPVRYPSAHAKIVDEIRMTKDVLAEVRRNLVEVESVQI